MGPYGLSADLTVVVVIGVLALIMRWVFHRPRRVIARPVNAADSRELGLLTVVATALPRTDAIARRAVLEDAGIRSSISRRHDGTMDILVFSGDVEQARILLGP